MAGSIRAGEFFFDAAIRTGRAGLFGGALMKDIGQALGRVGKRVGATGGAITAAFAGMTAEAAKFSEAVKTAGSRLPKDLKAVKDFSGQAFGGLVESGQQLDQAMTKASAAFKAVRLAIAQAITPAVVALSERFVESMGTLFRIIQNNRGAVATVAGIGGGAAIAGGSLLGLGAALTAAGTAFTAVSGAASIAMAGIGALLTPVGALTAAIGVAAGVGLVAAFSRLHEILQEIDFSSFIKGLRAAFQALEAGDWQHLTALVQNAFALLGAIAGQAFVEEFRKPLEFMSGFDALGAGFLFGGMGGKATTALNDGGRRIKQLQQKQLQLIESLRVSQGGAAGGGGRRALPFVGDWLSGQPRPPHYNDIEGGVTIPMFQGGPLPPMIRRQISGITGGGIIGGLASQSTLTGMIQGIEEKQLKEQEKTNDLLFELVQQNEQGGPATFR